MNDTVYFSHVQFEPFRNPATKGKDEKTRLVFSVADVCEQDRAVSDVVPIAVGIALAALVVIVVIAYIIGRRRARQRGYQTV